MFCTACAALNAVAARSCHDCGTGLRPWPEPGHLASPARPGRLRLVRLVLMLTPVALLLVLGGGYVRGIWTEPSVWMGRAEVAVAAGRYAEALDAYAAAGDYDGADRHRAELATVLDRYRPASDAAAAALAAGQPEAAMRLIAPVVAGLPGDGDAAELLTNARVQYADELRRDASDAEARRDWLAAERALAAIVAVDPSDLLAAERLATVRRDHAPIVFTRDRMLYLVGPDGTDERLVTDERSAAWPTWSPDRTRIAFTSTDDGAGQIALYVVNVDGTGLTRLAEHLRPYSGPVWSPDGASIAFAVEGGGEELVGQTEPNPAGIQVVDVATGRVSDLTAGRIREPLYPSWSPTGDRLAFVSRGPESNFEFGDSTGAIEVGYPAGEVYVVDVATREMTNLSAGRVDHPWRLAWSPVDERVLVYTRDPGMSYDRDQTRLTLLNAVSGEKRLLTAGGERLTMPVWSPDGQRLAYAAGEETLVIRDLTGGMHRVVLDTLISRFVTWSADGTAVLAVGDGVNRPSFVVPVDAEPDTTLSPLYLRQDNDRRQAGAPRWSPINPVQPPAPPTVSGTALDHWHQD